MFSWRLDGGPHTYLISTECRHFREELEVSTALAFHVPPDERGNVVDALTLRGSARPLRASCRPRTPLKPRYGNLEARYAGAIPVDLLGQEPDRISKALASIRTELAATNEKWEVIERKLGLPLDLATDTHAAYLSAPEHIRRLFNQALSEKILILPRRERPRRRTTGSRARRAVRHRPHKCREARQ